MLSATWSFTKEPLFLSPLVERPAVFTLNGVERGWGPDGGSTPESNFLPPQPRAPPQGSLRVLLVVPPADGLPPLLQTPSVLSAVATVCSTKSFHLLFVP